MVMSLPKFIDPFMLADKNAGIEGELPLSGFDRLDELLSDKSGQVKFSLKFAKAGKFAKVEGHLFAELSLRCQRCLGALAWPVAADIKLGIVNSVGLIDRLPHGFEPLLLADEKVAIKDIIEDELLLNLPSVPKHEDNCRIVNFSGHTEGLIVENAQSVPKNPFSILADLKKLEIYNGSTKK